MRIEDLKEGDKLKLINQNGWGTIKKGRNYRVESCSNTGLRLDNGTRVSCQYLEDFRLAPRSSWHPHHDAIVAWAKGETVQYDTLLGGGWIDWESSDKAPGFQREHKYRVKPEPDHTAEIAQIEQEMRVLADRLEKLK